MILKRAAKKIVRAIAKVALRNMSEDDLKRIAKHVSPNSPRPGEMADLPYWYSETFPSDPAQDINSSKALGLYQSWIPQHTDSLVKALEPSDDYRLVDLDLFKGLSSKRARRDMLGFARNQPELYRKMVIRKLAPYRNRADFLIVSFDWHPLMRQIVYCAAELGIKTILIPHESVFAKAEMYYRDPKTDIDVPAADIVLAWGDLQEQIFVERGYPRSRIVKVGAPKFDYVHRVRERGTREPARVLGLDANRPIITFAAQPLDSQYDTRQARVAQSQAINDTIDAADEVGAQVIIRTPPSMDQILNKELTERISLSGDCVLEDARIYLLSPEQTIEVSDVVVSINSTMLLEAALAGKVAITSKYLEFEQIWDPMCVGVARNKDEMLNSFRTALSSPHAFTDNYNLEWAAASFSIGRFDGRATERIMAILAEVAQGRRDLEPFYPLTQPFYRRSHMPNDGNLAVAAER